MSHQVRARRFLFLTAAILTTAIACGKTPHGTRRPDGGSSVGDDASARDDGPTTLLQQVAAIVVPNCGIGGCHDSASVTHGMDLTSADKIHDAWVNQEGFDHCVGREVPRVIPGDPDGSLVVIKITGVAVCAESQRMPLPPLPPLTSDQVDVIRSWIAANAPSDRPQIDGAVAADAREDGGDTGPEDDAGMRGCTSSLACGPELTCTGNRCDEPWECVAHFDDTLAHPCAPETISFCGCDGVTFEASVTCPDRPWQHAGACEDGANCNSQSIACSDPKPVCREGQEASVVNGCWGPCVDISQCRCLYHWMCPTLTRYTCLMPAYRCGPNPAAGDTASDASVDASVDFSL